MIDGVCKMCGEFSPWCRYHDELGILLCKDCYEKVEKHHKVDGKFVVDRCKYCGHIKGVYFIKYKRRGRPAGSKNKPKPPQEVIPLMEAIE